jgi:hypothetical protein
LKLIDEVNLDKFLKEASDAIVDADRFTDFVREKATVAIERFLDYLPKMSIPVKQRELSDGWVLTCHGEDGGDLTLSDATIRRENLCCQVLGGETMFFPMFGQGETDLGPLSSSREQLSCGARPIETSILDHIRNLLETTRTEGCWEVGFGGVEKVSACGRSPYLQYPHFIKGSYSNPLPFQCSHHRTATSPLFWEVYL